MSSSRSSGGVATLVVILSPLGCARADSVQDRADLQRWSVTEELRIGSLDDPTQLLTGVGGLAVDREDRFYVAQPQDGVVLVFDAQGPRLRTIGGPGQGPGEFERLYRIGLLADTLYAVDYTSRRVTFFTLTGELLSSFTIRPPVDPPFSSAPPFLLFADGTAVTTVGVPVGLPGLDLSRIPYLRVDRRGEILDTMARNSLERRFRPMLEGRDGRSVGGGQQPFFDGELIVISLDGTRVAEVTRRSAESPGTATFRVTVTDTQSDTVLSRSYDYTPIGLPEAVVDSAVAESARARANFFPSLGAAEAAIRKVTDVPAYFPPIAEAEYAETGHLWLRREDVPFRIKSGSSWMQRAIRSRS